MITQAEKDAAVALAKAKSGAAIDELAVLIPVTVTPPPPVAQTIDTFTVMPSSLSTAASVTVAWSTSGATTVLLDGVVVGAVGSVLRKISVTTSYTLTAKGSAPDVTRTVTATVAATPPPPTPVDCVLSDWGPWVNDGAPTPCVAGFQQQPQKRTRTVVTSPSNGGAACGPLTETQTITVPCTVTPPPPTGRPLHAVVSIAVDSPQPNIAFVVRATVIGNAPTGMVSIEDANQASQKGIGPLVGTGDTRTFAISLTLPAGNYALLARYAGDANNLPTTSDALPLTLPVVAVTPPPVEPPSTEGATILAANLTSRAVIEANFTGFPVGPPTLDTTEYIPLDADGYPGVVAARCWAAVGINERIISWHHPFEPEARGRAFGNGYEHLAFEYLLRIGEDVGASMTADGCKLLGFSGLYDLDAGGVQLPQPPMNAYAGWEVRLWHGPETVLGYRLACYAYLTRDPRNGTSATVGKYGGNGNPNGPLMTSGYLVPGRVHRIRQEVRLNTVKNKALIVPTSTGGAEQIQEMMDNCNLDGLLRISLDGQVVGEWTTVGYRGLDRARIFEVFANIYQGGAGIYPRSPEHYDLAGILVTERIVSGGTIPPVAQTIDSFSASPASLPVGGGAVAINWSTSNATSVLLDGQTVSTSGSVSRTATATTTYTLIARKDGAPDVSRTLTVTVAVPSEPPPPTSGELLTIAHGTARNLGTWIASNDPAVRGRADYSGITLDAEGNRIIQWGGVHGNLGPTDIRAMSLVSPFTWSSLYPSMPPEARVQSDQDMTIGFYRSTNHRVPMHTYNSLAIPKSLRKLYTMSSSPTSGIYDFNAPVPGSPTSWSHSNLPPQWFFPCGVCLTADGSKILVASGGLEASGWAQVWLYDPETDTDVHIPVAFGAGGICRVTPSVVFHPDTGKYYIFQDTGVWALTLDSANPAASTCVQVTTTGQGPGGYFALGYDPVNHDIGGMSGTVDEVPTGEFFKFKPATGAWSKSIIRAENGDVPSVRFHNAAFEPSGCYIALATTTGYPTWAIRPPA